MTCVMLRLRNAVLLILALCGSAPIWAQEDIAATQPNRIYLPVVMATPAVGVNLTIKATNYTPPPDALFVALSGNDANSGSQNAPLRTVARAVAQAPNGGTIVLRGGAYRESVVISNKTLTIQPYPGERVIFSGAVDVQGWVRDGSAWRRDGWTFNLQQGVPSTFIDPAFPLAGSPDMVFVNGTPLRQVSSRSAVTAGTFYADYAGKRIYIGDNPTGRRVEVTVLAQALYFTSSARPTVRGIAFTQYGTNRNQHGAVRSDAPNAVFENNTFAWNAASGLTFFGDDTTVRGNLFISNGQLGLFGSGADRALVERNQFVGNNLERFASWESGGAKLATARDAIIRDNLAEGNFDNGIWIDVGSYNAVIARNTARDNTRHGIMIEISAKAIVASNIVARNGVNGIFILESEDIDIYNNTVVSNARGLRVVEGDRTSGDPLISRDVRDIVVRNNLWSNVSDAMGALVVVDDDADQRTAEQMGVSLNRNGYYRTNASQPTNLIAWANGAPGFALYQNLAAFRSATGQENNGITVDDTATNPFFVNVAAGNYQLKSGSLALGAGESLPSAIADAIGVASGVAVDLGVLDFAERWR